MVDAAAAEPGLGDDEALAGLAEQVVPGHAHVVVADVGVGALAFVADRHVAQDLHPRRVGGHDEHGHALVGRRLRVGHRHDDQEGGVAGVRREPLLAVDDPLIADQFGGAGEHLGVGAALGFGHGVAGADLVVEQRLQVLVLLGLGAVVGQYLGVAGIRGLAAERHRRTIRLTKVRPRFATRSMWSLRPFVIQNPSNHEHYNEMSTKRLRKPSQRLRKILADNIRAFRTNHGLSQEALASKSNLHRTYIGAIERGERNVTLSSLEVLADALDITVAELLSYEDLADGK